MRDKIRRNRQYNKFKLVEYRLDKFKLVIYCDHKLI